MSEIEKLLKECWKAGKTYGGNWTDKNFNDFMDKHQEQVKLFAIPVVVKSLTFKQLDEILQDSYSVDDVRKYIEHKLC